MRPEALRYEQPPLFMRVWTKLVAILGGLRAERRRDRAVPQVLAQYLRLYYEEGSAGLGHRLASLKDPSLENGIRWNAPTAPEWAAPAWMKSAGISSAAVGAAAASAPTAVILHLFYEDLADEIAASLRGLPPHDLFVSLNPTIEPGEFARVSRLFPNARFFCFENRGRDVLPFLELLGAIDDSGYRFILKIHSKKSLNNEYGDAWRKELYRSLTATENVTLVQKMISEKKWALAAPGDYLLSYSVHYGRNHAAVMQLLHRLELKLPRNGAFFAGTMFWASPQELRFLLRLGLRRSNFENEAGQIDGTLAHALERVIPLSVQARGGHLGLLSHDKPS